MQKGTSLENSTLQISALSRALDVGTLYDARSDKLIPGRLLWSMEEIKEKTQISPQRGNRFQVSASESLREKTKLLDVSASVKLSFMGGLIEAGGSAKYLNEKTSSTQQCRVTLDYHETTETRELMITDLGDPDREVLTRTDATHVVTMVLYGADALMEFQQIASDESQRQEIEGNLNVMIKKIPSVEISGEGSLNMNDAEREMVKNFSCTFYGDYKLQEVPSSFEEAVNVYKQLPSLLGENGEHAVPLKVWLYPLSKLGSTEFRLKAMISEALVSAVEKKMDDLHHAEIRTNDLLEKSIAIKAKDIVDKLEKFQSNLRVSTAEFLKKMTDLIPDIRGGDVEETNLRELLNSQDASGFIGNEMEQWLDGKEDEINTVTMYIKKLEYGIKTPGPELNSFLMDPDVNDAFVFNFNSLKYEEPYLDKISQTTTSINSQSEEVPWYRRPEVKEVLNSALNVFNNKIYGKNKVISFIPDPEHFGASVRWYQHAVLKDPHVTTDPILTVIPAPEHLTTSSISTTSASLSWQVSPEVEQIPHSFLVSYQSEGTQPQTISTDSCSADITGLELGTEYTVSVITQVQQGAESSSASLQIKTDGLTLDPDTASRHILLSEENHKATGTGDRQSYPDHPQRFDDRQWHVLSREPLTAHCYWEAEWNGPGICIAVAFASISRSVSLAKTPKAWSLEYGKDYKYGIWHNGSRSSVSNPPAGCWTAGVRVDRDARTVSFYWVTSNSRIHLRTYNITHTVEPLHAAIGIYRGSSYSVTLV